MTFVFKECPFHSECPAAAVAVETFFPLSGRLSMLDSQMFIQTTLCVEHPVRFVPKNGLPKNLSKSKSALQKHVLNF